MPETLATLLISRNSGAGGCVNSKAIKLDGVAKARRPLTDEEREDARRLHAIWLRRKGELGVTQEQLAADCGWTTQSALNQYLRGVIPLNLEAALKLARALRVEVSDLSPRLASLLPPTPHRIGEEAASYQKTKTKEVGEDPRRLAWNRLYEELERKGMSDVALRMIKHLASELRREKGAVVPNTNARRKKKAR